MSSIRRHIPQEPMQRENNFSRKIPTCKLFPIQRSLSRLAFNPQTKTRHIHGEQQLAQQNIYFHSEMDNIFNKFSILSPTQYTAPTRRGMMRGIARGVVLHKFIAFMHHTQQPSYENE